MSDPDPQSRRLRLAVLFSGGGRTLENMASRIRDGSLPAECVVAISSHSEAGGIGRAKRLGIPCAVVDYKQHKDSLSGEILRIIREAGPVDLIALAGFIRPFCYPAELSGKIMNIHPALLPSFGGKGFYGERVHEAVLASGVKFSGCTVHFVTEDYDSGPIILQRIVPVLPDDTPHSLAERVFAEECIAYPEAIRLFAEGKLEVRGSRVFIKD